MKKFVAIFLLPLFIYSQGLEFISPGDAESIDRFDGNSFGYSESIPASYSLKKYVPPVRDQGNTGTCVGFSMGYYAISTIHNIYFDRTNTYAKFVHAFDPLYAYTLNESDCSEGLNMVEAFKRFSNYGAKKSVFYPIDIDCESPLTTDILDEINPIINPYQLEGFEFIQTYNKNFIENVKKSISNKSPVIIGANITESLYEVTKSPSSGNMIWKPKADEENEGGHAMCVIGYNDNLDGGSFQIVNSWGADWGEDGYFWITYDDFYAKVDEAYVIKPYNLNLEDKTSNDISFDQEYIHYEGDDQSWIYEGQTNVEGKFDGVGILTTTRSDGSIYHTIGSFEKYSREGKHLLVDSNGFFSVNFVNDEAEEIKELGFSSQEPEFKTQMKKIGYDIEIKNMSKSEIENFKFGDSVGKWKIRKRKRSE